MTTFKVNEIQNFWTVETSESTYEVDTETAQQILDMVISDGGKFEIYQGRHEKLFFGEALGMGMVAAMKAEAQMVYKS